jgi:hypothetical protein
MERSSSQGQGALALGGVMIAAAVVMIEIRFFDDWSKGANAALTLGAFALLFGTAMLVPRLDPPATHQSALLLSGLAVFALALVHIARLLGANDSDETAGSILWTALALSAVAWFAALRFHSAACALVGTLVLGVGTIALIEELFSPDDPQIFRWIIAGFTAAYLAGAVLLRRRSPHRFAPQMVNAAAATLIVFGYGSIFTFDDEGEFDGFGLDRGWEAYLIGGSLLVVAYAVLERERGPGFLGALSLLISVSLVAGEKETLLIWPLALLVLGAAGLLAGLRQVRRVAAGPADPGVGPAADTL